MSHNLTLGLVRRWAAPVVRFGRASGVRFLLIWCIAWATAAVGCARSPGATSLRSSPEPTSAARTEPVDAIIVLGASVSTGAPSIARRAGPAGEPGSAAPPIVGSAGRVGDRSPTLAEAVHARLPTPSGSTAEGQPIQVESVADGLAFLDPVESLRAQVTAAQSLPRTAEVGHGTLVLAVDALFWTVYGPNSSEEGRLIQLEDALEALARLAPGPPDPSEQASSPCLGGGPGGGTLRLLLGDLPDRRSAVAALLGERAVPTVETLAAANGRIEQWASARAWVRIVPVAAIARSVALGSPLTVGAVTVQPDAGDPVLAADGLHLTPSGTAVLARVALGLSTDERLVTAARAAPTPSGPSASMAAAGRRSGRADLAVLDSTAGDSTAGDPTMAWLERSKALSDALQSGEVGAIDAATAAVLDPALASERQMMEGQRIRSAVERIPGLRERLADRLAAMQASAKRGGTAAEWASVAELAWALGDVAAVRIAAARTGELVTADLLEAWRAAPGQVAGSFVLAKAIAAVCSRSEPAIAASLFPDPAAAARAIELESADRGRSAALAGRAFGGKPRVASANQRLAELAELYRAAGRLDGAKAIEARMRVVGSAGAGPRPPPADS